MLWFMTVLISYQNRRTTDAALDEQRTLRLTANGGRRTAKGLLWTLVFCCFTLMASGQVTGYQGKRMMFKTDLISPVSERGINLGLEYVFLRNVVFGLDFSLTGKRYTQYLKSYQNIHGEYPTIKASIRDMQVGITGQYFLNTALPAPKGSYIFVKYHLGKADVFAVEHIIEGGESILQGFEISDIPSRQFDIGVGYQEVFFGFLLVDFGFGVSAASLLIDKSENEIFAHRKDIIADFSANHGPNIISMGSWRNTPGGIGLSIHLKVGILLF